MYRISPINSLNHNLVVSNCDYVMNPDTPSHTCGNNFKFFNHFMWFSCLCVSFSVCVCARPVEAPSAEPAREYAYSKCGGISLLLFLQCGFWGEMDGGAHADGRFCCVTAQMEKLNNFCCASPQNVILSLRPITR